MRFHIRQLLLLQTCGVRMMMMIDYDSSVSVIVDAVCVVFSRRGTSQKKHKAHLSHYHVSELKGWCDGWYLCDTPSCTASFSPMLCFPFHLHFRFLVFVFVFVMPISTLTFIIHRRLSSLWFIFGTLMSILCHWAWLMRASSADPTCYFPNGKVARTYQPCNSTDDDHASVCCELSSSVCSTKNLCYGSNGYVYRGGCTDPSWKSALCPTLCLTGKKLSVKFTKTVWSEFYRADSVLKLQRTHILPSCHVRMARSLVIFAALLRITVGITTVIRRSHKHMLWMNVYWFFFFST